MKLTFANLKTYIITAFFVTMIPLTYASSLPSQATLAYELSTSGQELGVVERTLSKQGNVYSGQSIAKPNFFAKLFMKGDITESCQFSMDKNGYKPIAYQSVRTEYKPYDREATFNAQQVTYKDGRNEHFDGILWDQGCFAYGLSTTNLTAAKSKTIYLNDGNKSRVFLLTETANETISVPAGEFNVIRVRLERQDKKNQHTMLWVDTKTGIPVKTTNAREGKPSITMTLLTIN